MPVNEVLHQLFIAEVDIRIHVLSLRFFLPHFLVLEEEVILDFHILHHHDVQIFQFPLRVSNRLIEFLYRLLEDVLHVHQAVIDFASNHHHPQFSVLRMSKIKRFHCFHLINSFLKQLGAPTTVDVPIHKSPRNPDHIGSEFRGQRYNKMLKPTWYVPGTRTRYELICETLFTLYNRLANRYLSILQFLR